MSKQQPITIEQTQRLLGNDEALVTVDLDESSYIWVITKDRADWKELSVSAEDVSKEVSALRAGLNPDAPKRFDSKLAYQLYQQVIGPIEEIISQKTRLSFVVDGALTSLPLQVLVATDPNGKDLVTTCGSHHSLASWRPNNLVQSSNSLWAVLLVKV